MANALEHATELLPGRLFFLSLNRIPKSTSTCHYYSIDDELQYLPFLADFGPLHLGCVYRFCVLTEDLLSAPEHAGKRLCLVTSPNHHLRANAACLAALFLVIVMRHSPDDAWRRLAGVYVLEKKIFIL
jgi:cell division cycle 14